MASTSTPPPATSLLDLPALVVSTHILPRLPASSIGRFACSCRAARDATHEDERLWKLLCARRLGRWCPGAVDAAAPGAWNLPRRVRWAGRPAGAGPALGLEGDADLSSGDDDGFEEVEDFSPSYRDIYSRLLGWDVPGAILGPHVASPDGRLGAREGEGRSRRQGPSRALQKPRFRAESRRETAARSPLGSLLSFEPDLSTGTVVGFALSPPLEMGAGFLRTPLFELAPSRRAGRAPRRSCLRFAQQAAEHLSSSRSDARARRARRHYEAHGVTLAVCWKEPERDSRDGYDLACQELLEAEARGRGRGSERAAGGGGGGGGGGEAVEEEGRSFSSSGLLSISSPSSSSPPPSPSSPSSSFSPLRRPCFLLGPCDASCRQTHQEVICRSDALCVSLPPPPRGRQQQQPGGGGRGGRGGRGTEAAEEEEEEEAGRDHARFSRGVAPAVPGRGCAYPPLDRLGDGRGGGGGGIGGSVDGISALPHLSESGRRRTPLDFLLTMGGLDMRILGGEESSGGWQTVLYEPLDESQLEGIWKGDFGVHGVEVVRISRYSRPEEVVAALKVVVGGGGGGGENEDEGDGDDENENEKDAPLFAAIKLTGDSNVPAGSVSFALRASREDCTPEEDYASFSGTLVLNADDEMGALPEATAAAGEGPVFDLLRLSERPNRGLGAPLSLPPAGYGSAWRCEHDLTTADPSPVRVRGHWKASALISPGGFEAPRTVPAQVVSASRDCFFVAWGGGMRKLSLFARVYEREMQWAGPEGAR